MAALNTRAGMAVLTDDQNTELRRNYAAEAPVVRINKTETNAVNQAIEDWWELLATRQSLSNAIEAAVPGLTNEEKRRYVKHWLRQRFDRGN